VIRRVLGQVLLGAATLVCVAATVELAAALRRALVCPGAPPTFAVPDRSFGWTHPASTTVHAYGCAGSEYEWSTWVAFNSHGLNSSEHTYRPDPDVARILVLGDSVTEALQVQRSQNFSERLQAMLRERGRPVEVINTGHAGYGTDNELLFFESEGIRYRPDVVLLAFNLQNDVAENSPVIAAKMYAGGPQRPKADVRLGPDGKLLIDKSAYERFAQTWEDRGWTVKPPMPWLRSNSFFVRRIYDLLGGDRGPSLPSSAYPVHFDVYRSAETPDWAAAWNITGALLRELGRVTRASGARFLVAVIPSHEGADPAQWEKLAQWFPALGDGTWDVELPRRRALDLLAAEGLNAIDTTPVFRRHRDESGESGFFGFDPHPNASGQRWIAEAVMPALERELAAVESAPRVKSSQQPAAR